MTVRPIGVQDGLAPTLIQQNGQAVITEFADGAGSEVARVVTPNAETIFATDFSPSDAGTLFMALDITPEASGLLIISVNIAIVAEGTDQPSCAMFYVDDLTAITGGTLIAPGITAVPTATTPAFGAGVEVFAASNATQLVDEDHISLLTFAGIPVQAVAGHRTGLVFVADSPAEVVWATVACSLSVIEQP